MPVLRSQDSDSIHNSTVNTVLHHSQPDNKGCFSRVQFPQPVPMVTEISVRNNMSPVIYKNQSNRGLVYFILTYMPTFPLTERWEVAFPNFSTSKVLTWITSDPCLVISWLVLWETTPYLVLKIPSCRQFRYRVFPNFQGILYWAMIKITISILNLRSFPFSGLQVRLHGRFLLICLYSLPLRPEHCKKWQLWYLLLSVWMAKSINFCMYHCYPVCLTAWFHNSLIWTVASFLPSRPNLSNTTGLYNVKIKSRMCQSGHRKDLSMARVAQTE